MARDREMEVWRTKDDRAWRIGDDADIAWIQENTNDALAITSAIPPVFEASVTVELPGTGNHDAAAWLEDPDRHDAGVLAVLSEHTAVQPWWLGYLDTGSADVVFYDVSKVTLYSGWEYVLVKAGPEQARIWGGDHRWKGVLRPAKWIHPSRMALRAGTPRSDCRQCRPRRPPDRRDGPPGPSGPGFTISAPRSARRATDRSQPEITRQRSPPQPTPPFGPPPRPPHGGSTIATDLSRSMGPA